MLFLRLFFIIILLANIGFFIYSRENIPKTQKFVAVDAGVNKLVLLSELDVENTIWEEAQVVDNSVEATEVFNQECYSIGAFKVKSDLQSLLNELKNNVIKIRSREVISSQEAGYWVFLPAMKTRNEALVAARELAKMDIKDYYVVTAGEHENTISLGLYRDSENANTRLQELSNYGFKAEKEVRIEQWPEFWLDYAVASDRTENLIDYEQLDPEISTNQVECNW
jgi:hypothetical protein